MRSPLQRLSDEVELDGKYMIYLAGWNENNPIYQGYEQVFSNKGKNNKNNGRPCSYFDTCGWKRAKI